MALQLINDITQMHVKVTLLSFVSSLGGEYCSGLGFWSLDPVVLTPPTSLSPLSHHVAPSLSLLSTLIDTLDHLLIIINLSRICIYVSPTAASLHCFLFCPIFVMCTLCRHSDHCASLIPRLSQFTSLVHMLAPDQVTCNKV